MIVQFQTRPWRRAAGIVFYTWKELLTSTLIIVGVYVTHEYFGIAALGLGGAIPLGVVGTALAIFLGFRNNSAYDRWWEGRKIWGGVVNISRTIGTQIMTYVTDHHVKKEISPESLNQTHRELIYRHLAYLHALRLHLRQQHDQMETTLAPYLSAQELQDLLKKHNKPTHINFNQSQRLKAILKDNLIEDFRLYEMMRSIDTLYTLQGQCERIKNTPFPLYYSFFTRMILYVFVLFLPLSVISTFQALTQKLGYYVTWMVIPVCMMTAFVLAVIERTSRTSENPFENYFGDVPMTTLCRVIEIDLRQMLGETDTVPPPMPVEITSSGIRILR